MTLNRLSTLLMFSTLNLAHAGSGPSSSNVLDYGAAGDGSTDDTQAFNACLQENSVCWVDPERTFVVGDVHMINGNRLIGLGSVEYGNRNSQSGSRRAVLIGKPGASNVIDVSYVTESAGIEGIFIDCDSRSINGISGGSFQLSIQDTTVVNCKHGLGGFGANNDNDEYSGEVHITNSTFGNNDTGISNIVDSFVLNADFANNQGNGIYLGGGSNSNTIVNSRFEWNDGHGISTYGGTGHNVISNSIFDRNGKAAIRLHGADGFSISNNDFFRNASDDDPYEQAASQVLIEHSKNISITGGTSQVGRNDDNSGPATPRHVVAYHGENKNISIAGFVTSGQYHDSGNTSGSYTVSAVLGDEPTEGYSVSGVNDIPRTKNTVTGFSAYAGGGQADATLLTASVNTVSVVPSKNASVKLMPCVPGREQVVANLGSEQLKVYGSYPDTIHQKNSSSGLVQKSNRVATYICTGNGNWSRLY